MREADEIAYNHFVAASDALNEVWRQKLGLDKWKDTSQFVISRLLELMHYNKADYTMTWRVLCDVAEHKETTADRLVNRSVFYEAPERDDLVKWNDWIRLWQSEGFINVDLMRMANPLYVPREWMLVQAYEKAYRGDYSLVHELCRLFERPYELQSTALQESYFRRAPESAMTKVTVFVTSFCLKK